MKKLIITGGAGFIGSNAVDYFMDKNGYQLTAIIDKITYAADITRINKHPSLRLYKCDVADAKLNYIFKNEEPNVVIHMAAESHVDRSISVSNTDDFINSNYLSVAKLVNAIRIHRIKTGKDIFLVHISTDEVLGDMPMDSNEEFDENQPLQPNNPYAATKAAAEQLIQAMHHTYNDFNYTILRATNNYGANQHLEKFIPTVISSILQNKKIPLYGKGENVREWLWTGDFIAGIERVISQYYKEPNNICGKVFHFGSGFRITNLEVVTTILTKMGKSNDMIEFVTDRPGHDRKYALNCTNTQNILNWDTEVSFAGGGIQMVIKDITQRLGELKQ